MTITALYHYPVKGLSAQPLSQVHLKPGLGFPLDRVYALTDGTWVFDPMEATPQPKTRFLTLMAHEKLAKLRCYFEQVAHTLHIEIDDGTSTTHQLHTLQGRESIANFFAEYMAEDIGGQPAVAHKPGHLFTDISVVSPELMNSFSLINLATLRQLEAHIKCELDPMRFRANVYYEGEPGVEQDWLDKEIQIGGVRARVNFKTRRCPATNVNPKTGERDQRIPTALMECFGHNNLGVYAEVLTAGNVHVGDALNLV